MLVLDLPSILKEPLGSPAFGRFARCARTAEVEHELTITWRGLKLHRQGKVADLHSELDFLHRFTALYAQSSDVKDLVFKRFGWPRPIVTH